jgi:hypothetical protein
MLEYLFDNNQTAYDNYVMLSELLLQAEMELGSENSGLAESQTQKINRKREEAQTEKKALNSVAVTNAESVEEAAVSETSQTAESSLEKSVNVGVAEDKVSAQEEETLGKEAGTQSQSVSENEAAKQKQNTSGNEGVFFNQSGEGSNDSTKPHQVHHFATNKNKKYTSQFENITQKYGLDLDEDWNKKLMPHQGRHPNAYHDYVLDNMQKFDRIANGDRTKFLKLYDQMKQKIINNPEMLYKNYWKKQ